MPGGRDLEVGVEFECPLTLPLPLSLSLTNILSLARTFSLSLSLSPPYPSLSHQLVQLTVACRRITRHDTPACASKGSKLLRVPPLLGCPRRAETPSLERNARTKIEEHGRRPRGKMESYQSP